MSWRQLTHLNLGSHFCQNCLKHGTWYWTFVSFLVFLIINEWNVSVPFMTPCTNIYTNRYYKTKKSASLLYFHICFIHNIEEVSDRSLHELCHRLSETHITHKTYVQIGEWNRPFGPNSTYVYTLFMYNYIHENILSIPILYIFINQHHACRLLM